MGNEARYGIKFDSNAKQVGDEGALALTALKDSIDSSKQAVKGYSDALRNLKGKSEEVSAVRASLKAKIDAEKNAISASTVALLKQGSSYDKVSEQQKKFTDASKESSEKLSGSIDKIGGPVAEIKSKFSQLSGILDAVGGGGMAAVAIGATAAVAAVAVLAAGIVALTSKLFEFILTTGDAARNMQLSREAFVGNAVDAEHLGNQIDALGKKVPLGTEALNQMANKLVLAGVQGQTLVDTLNATAQASAALGDGAASKLSEFIERGRLSQRFALNPLELQGTGVAFADVAKALASSTKSSVADATRALYEGRVTLGAGAAALRLAVENRFGKVNLEKQLSLDSLKESLQKNFLGLIKGIDIEPVLKGFASLISLFDSSTVTGSALKQVLGWFGKGLLDDVTKAIPKVKEFFETAVLYALKLESEYLSLRIGIKSVFGSDVLGDISAFDVAINSLEASTIGLRVAWEALTLPLTIIDALLPSIKRAVSDIAGLFTADQWTSIGSAIVDGILGPLRGLPDAVSEIAGKIPQAVRSVLKIQSPSKVFEGIGQNVNEGFAQGIDKGSAHVNAAMDRTTSSVAGAASVGGSAVGGATTITVPVTVNFSGGGKSDAGTMESMAAKIRAEVTHAIEVALIQAGRGVPA